MRRKKYAVPLICAGLVIASLGACSEKTQNEAQSTSAETKEKTTASDSEPEDSTDTDQGVEDTEPQTEESTEAANVHTAQNPMSLEEIKADVATGEIKSPVLKEVCSFEVPSDHGFLSDYYSQNDDILSLRSSSENHLGFYDYRGEPLLGGEVENVTKFEYSNYFVCSKSVDDDKSVVCLIDAQANVIVPFSDGAGAIKEIPGTDRFVEVYFLDRITENQEESVYSGLKWYDNTLGLAYYTGTVKVFDIKTGKYLEKTLATRAPYYGVFDDLITNVREYDSNKELIYVTASDDTVHEMGAHYSLSGDKLLLYRDYEAGITQAYDHDMNLLFTTPYELQAYTSDFYIIKDKKSELKGIVHYSGLVILEPKYKDVRYLDDGNFAFQSEDLTWGIANIEGKEMVPATYKNISFSGIPGYYVGRKTESFTTDMDIIDRNGNVVKSDADFRVDSAFLNHVLPYQNYLGYYDYDTGRTSYFVVNDQDLTLEIPGTFTYFGGYILYSLDDSTLYDLVTGEKLAEGFDSAMSAYGYVYILKDYVMTVYEVSFE